jgi:GcrA cell cycle regulator
MAALWTAERIDVLKLNWEAGFSASQIAKILGDVTRNGVVGKIFRLGLSNTRAPYPKRPPKPPRRPTTQEAGPPKKRVHKPKRQFNYQWGAQPMMTVDEPPVAPIEDPVPEPLHKRLVDLEEGQCRYPYGDRDFTFCGRRCLGNLPYCPAHARITGRAP